MPTGLARGQKRFRRRFGKAVQRLYGPVFRHVRKRRTWHSRVAPLLTDPHHFRRVCSLNNLVQSNVNSVVAPGAQNPVFTITGDGNWALQTGNGGSSNVTYFSLGIFFTLDMLPDVSEFSSLFDAYLLQSVKIKITPFSTQSNLETGVVAGTSASQPLSIFAHHIIDHDDAVPVTASNTGLNLMREYATYKSQNPLRKPIKRFVSPRLAASVFAAAGGGAPVVNEIITPKWINFAGSGMAVTHYGFKLVFQVISPDNTINSIITFKPEAHLYFKCKDVR